MVHFVLNWSKMRLLSLGLHGNNWNLYSQLCTLHNMVLRLERKNWKMMKSLHYYSMPQPAFVSWTWKNVPVVQSSNIAKRGGWGGGGGGKSKYFINFVEKPQCCSHLQLLWNYVVGMLTNWASWIDWVIADLSEEFHRFFQHLKRNSKEFLFLVVRWHPLTDRYTTLRVGCHEINNVKIIILS